MERSQPESTDTTFIPNPKREENRIDEMFDYHNTLQDPPCTLIVQNTNNARKDKERGNACNLRLILTHPVP